MEPTASQLMQDATRHADQLRKEERLAFHRKWGHKYSLPRDLKRELDDTKEVAPWEEKTR